MTHIEAKQFGESRPMPESIEGKSKLQELVYVSPFGYPVREQAWEDFNRIRDLHVGWLNAFDENEGIFQSSDDHKFYVYMHRGLYV